MQYFLNYNLTPLDMYNLKFIVSNQKEESTSIQRVNGDQGQYKIVLPVIYAASNRGKTLYTTV